MAASVASADAMKVLSVVMFARDRIQ